MQLERRYATAPVTIVSGDTAAAKGRTVRGYAAMFNKRSDNLGTPQAPVFEVIAPGAFDGVLKNDIRCLFNHNADIILARSKGGVGTLKIGVDAVGLWYEFIAPDTTSGNDLLVSIKRGDIDQSSFAFSIAAGGDSWTTEKNGARLRTIKKVGKLVDCSPVAYPAYRTTTLTKRHGLEKAVEIVKSRAFHSDDGSGKSPQKELQGADVTRYSVKWSGTWVDYGPWVSTYLPLELFSGPRILIREISRPLPYCLLCGYSERTFVHNPSVLAVLPKATCPVSVKFVLGVLNSRMLSVIFHHFAPKADKGLFPKVLITDAQRLLLPAMNLAMGSQRRLHDELVSLVDDRTVADREQTRVQNEAERGYFALKIQALDRRIDDIVFQLYGLAESEIARVLQCSSEGDQRRGAKTARSAICSNQQTPLAKGTKSS